MLIQLGLKEDPENKKIVHRHSVINFKGVSVLRFTDTHHSTELQKSRYILIDSDEDRLRNLAAMQVH